MSDATNQKKRRIVLSMLLSAAGVVLCCALAGWSRSVSYNVVWVAAFAAFSVGAYLFTTLREKRLQYYFAVFGGIFVLVQALGYRLQAVNYTGAAGWALSVGIGLCFAPAAAYCFILLTRLIDKIKPAENKRPKAVFRLSFAVILLGWLPVFLAYYPGLFAYDVGVQIPQILDWAFTARHPLLHTLLIGGFYRLGGLLGSENIGIAVASAVQMAVMAAIFSWFVRYLYVNHSPRFLWLGSLIVFAVLPVHSILAVSMTKDVLFAGFLLLFLMRLHQLSLNPKLLQNVRWIAATAAWGVLACMFRNNTMVSLLLFIPICVFLVPKTYRLRCLALILGTILAFFGLHTGLNAVLNAHDPYIREYVSIPSQQLARVYALHPKDDDSTVIKWNVPAADMYDPYIADNTKGSAQVLTPESLVSFLKLWGLVGLRHPMEYIDAFLLNTQGYWWLNDTTHAAIVSEDPENRLGYLGTNTVPDFGVTHVSLFPGLETVYEYLFSANGYQRIPLLSFLFAPSAYIWFILFSLCRGLYRRRKDCVMVGGLLLCYLLPLLMGPCVLVRYAYPFFVCVPFLLMPQIPATDK